MTKNQEHQTLLSIRTRIRLAYGFVANPNFSKSHNAFILLSEMPSWHYFSRPTHTAFHDFTTRLKPPIRNLRALLGLGLKFIPTPRYSTVKSELSKDMESTLPQFSRDLHLACWFGRPEEETVTEETDPAYNPSMYVKSKWSPPHWAVPRPVSCRLESFTANVKTLFVKRRGRTNLLPYQRRALNWLATQDDFIIATCDKNLGPAIIEKAEYVVMCKKLLMDARVYHQLTRDEATSAMYRITELYTAWFTKWRKTLTPNERKYLNRYMDDMVGKDGFGVFYSMIKAHKSPIALRPVSSYSSNYLYALGVWCDAKLKEAAQKQDSYIDSSFTLLKQMKGLPNLPANAVLVTADAQSMYTNISTDRALHDIGHYLRTNADQFPNIEPRPLLAALTLVMKNNLFKFGDTFWKQIDGTAMGAPPAPPWATLAFAGHEDRVVTKYQLVIPFYRRFLDDILMIWLRHAGDEELWQEFITEMNEYGLVWDFSPRANTAQFLDLRLTITDGRIKTTMFEKALNLHLYIPPKSAHPPGVLTGLVMGMIFRIFVLCTNPPDRVRKTQDFFRHLIYRGYEAHTITPTFRKAITNALAYDGTPRATSHDGTILFKIPYHPQNPPSTDLQRVWRDTLSTPRYGHPLATIKNYQDVPIGLDRMIVCYRRPPNLRNLLSYRTLHFKSGRLVSSFFAPTEDD